MVRAAGKKQKGDEAFQTKKQKVGRKKLAPATSTRAEVTSRGLRVGVAKSILEAENKAKKQTQFTSFSSASEQHSLHRPANNGDDDHADNNNNKNNSRTAALPDITAVLVAVSHYKANARTQALKSAAIWVRHGDRAAANSPSLTIQLLTSALAALSDLDGPTRDAAAAVVCAIDQCVLGPSNAWPAVAESVCDRLNICLTHNTIGVRATAVQLLSDLSSKAKHETKAKMARTFLAYFASSAAAIASTASVGSTTTSSTSIVSSVAAYESGANAAAAAAAVGQDHATQANSAASTSSFKSRFEGHDESVISLIRNTIPVVKSKATTHFHLLPDILKGVLFEHDNDSTGAASNADDANATTEQTSFSSSSTTKVSSFVSRNHAFVVECLSEVWDFGCIRVKEQFETTVSLLRNEPALKMLLGIIDSTSFLISAIANNIEENQDGNTHNNNNKSINKSSLFPPKLLMSNLLHLMTEKVPFSFDDLCSLQSTSPRKAQMATTLGEMYLSLLQLNGAASRIAASSSASSPSINTNSSNAYLNQLLPSSSEIRTTVKKSYVKILSFGFELPSASSANWINFPELATFSFSSLGSDDIFAMLSASGFNNNEGNNNNSTFSLFESLPSWLMLILTVLDNNDKQQKSVNSQTEEAIFGLLNLISSITFLFDKEDDTETNNNSSLKTVITKCWEKLIQFHFLVRGNPANIQNNSTTTSTTAAVGVLPSANLRQQLTQKTVAMLHEFVSTCCRSSDLFSRLVKTSPSSSSSLVPTVSSAPSPWINILSSMSTLIAMVNQTQTHLGSSFAVGNNNNHSLHETRILAFGVMHFAGICLRVMGQPVPASWRVLLDSVELRREFTAKFHIRVGNEYLRLLDRILE